jgi:hypothetical protein
MVVHRCDRSGGAQVILSTASELMSTSATRSTPTTSKRLAAANSEIA